MASQSFIGRRSVPSTHRTRKVGTTAASVTLSAYMQDPDEVEETGICTSNIKALLAAFILFGANTAVQYVGAVWANSEALKADCISMGVDSMSYLLNVGAECLRGTSVFGISELSAGFISLAILLYFTGDFLLEQWETVSCFRNSANPQKDCESDAVNPWIIFGFMCLAVLVDGFASFFFYKSAQEEGGASMTMWTAALHIGADWLRTFVGIGLSVYLIFTGNPGAIEDAWSAVIICVLILIGVLIGFVMWAVEVKNYLVGPAPQPKENAPAPAAAAENARGTLEMGKM